jgi:hypothetical protein
MLKEYLEKLRNEKKNEERKDTAKKVAAGLIVGYCNWCSSWRFISSQIWQRNQGRHFK